MAASALRAASLAGGTGVALGAFGAHALQATLEATGRVETWRTGVQYHLLHAVALLGLAVRPAVRARPGWGHDDATTDQLV